MLNRILFIVLALTVSLTTSAINAYSQPQSSLTLEWIFSDEGRAVGSVPSHVWLADGRLMIYDGRLPPAQRAFEILDPKTGERRKALDMATGVASLNQLLPAEP